MDASYMPKERAGEWKKGSRMDYGREKLCREDRCCRVKKAETYEEKIRLEESLKEIKEFSV